MLDDLLRNWPEAGVAALAVDVLAGVDGVAGRLGDELNDLEMGEATTDSSPSVLDSFFLLALLSACFCFQ